MLFYSVVGLNCSQILWWLYSNYSAHVLTLIWAFIWWRVSCCRVKQCWGNGQSMCAPPLNVLAYSSLFLCVLPCCLFPCFGFDPSLLYGLTQQNTSTVNVICQWHLCLSSVLVFPAQTVTGRCLQLFVEVLLGRTLNPKYCNSWQTDQAALWRGSTLSACQHLSCLCEWVNVLKGWWMVKSESMYKCTSLYNPNMS